MAGLTELSKLPVIGDGVKEGLKSGLSTLIRCNPLVDGSIFAYQLCYAWLEEGGLVIYYVNNKRTDIVIEDFKRYGWNVTSYLERRKLVFIDAYSAIMGLSSQEAYYVRDPLDIKQINEMIIKAVKDFKESGKLLIVDSLSTLLDYFEAEAVNHVSSWNKLALVYNYTPLYIFTEWDYEVQLKQRLADLCDNVVDMKALEKNVVATEIFTVRKLAGKPVEKPIVPFKYRKPGGLKIYIPKILITGPYHAGKTTIVHALSTRAVSVQREGTTVALDFGHLEYKGLSADLFGTIGQQRFDPILEQLGGESVGVILVVDSTKPETFPRALEMLRKARVYGLPTVVLANKQDLPGTWPPEEVKARMKLPQEVPVIGTVATRKENVFEGLELLLKQIFGE